jgi:hypothetical protein
MVLSLIMLSLVFLLGSGILATTTIERKLAKTSEEGSQAIYLAEAGLARIIRDCQNDLNTDNNLNNSAFNAVGGVLTILPSSSSFYTVYNQVTLGNGNYTVQMKNVPADSTSWNADSYRVIVRSQGTISQSGTVVAQRTIECYLEGENVSPWNNALFAAGEGGRMVQGGNITLGGSVHLLGGNAVSATDTVLPLRWSYIYNHNNNMSGTLLGRLAASFTNLLAKVRVKKGRVELGWWLAPGTIGETNNYVDKILVGSGQDSDGNGVNDDILGGDNVAWFRNLFAREGAKKPLAYDNPGTTMPSIDTAWLNGNCLDLTSQTGAGFTTAGNMELWNTDFSYSSAQGSINYDANVSGSAYLTITGVVKVNSLDLRFQAHPTMLVNGKGILYTTGNMILSEHFYTQTSGAFPQNQLLGLIAGGNITIQGALNISAVIYAAGSVSFDNSTEIMGAVLCDRVVISGGIPRIWQVPQIIENLPQGMPGYPPYLWVIRKQTYREILW